MKGFVKNYWTFVEKIILKTSYITLSKVSSEYINKTNNFTVEVHQIREINEIECEVRQITLEIWLKRKVMILNVRKVNEIQV